MQMLLSLAVIHSLIYVTFFELDLLQTFVTLDEYGSFKIVVTILDFD